MNILSHGRGDLLSHLLLIFLYYALNVESNEFCSSGGYCSGDSCSLNCVESGGRQLPTFCLFKMQEEESTGYEVFQATLRSNCRAKVDFSTEAAKYLSLEGSPDRIVIETPVDVDVPLENGQRLERLFGAIGCSGDSNSQMQCFAIEVNDINDNMPVIKDDVYTASVTEVAIQFSSKDLTVSPTIEIYDPDQGDLSYGLLEDNIPFKLVPLLYDPDGPITCKPDKDFKIIVTDPAAIDYEATTSYNLTMMVWEGCGSSGDRTRNDTAVLTITVRDADDEFPYFHSPEYTATVLETNVNKPLDVNPKILASDGDRGLDEAMVYQLLNPDESRPDCLNNLEIDGGTGDITVVRRFSYDVNEGPCRLLLGASQADNPNRKTQSPLTVTILDANDKCPGFEQDHYDGNLIVGERIVTEVNSGHVLVVKLLDRDSTFVGSISILPPNTDFMITELTKSGSNAELKLTAADGVTIDRDATITLSVSDDLLENCNNIATVSVHFIEDPDQSLSPKFTETEYHATVSENSPVGSPITQVIVQNTGSSIEYSILSASLQGNLFITLNATTGQLTVAANINYEALGILPVFELQIQAKDTTWTYPRFGHTTVYITVEDEDEFPPTLQGFPVSLNIFENSPIDTEVYTVLVTDMDGTSSGDYVFSLSDYTHLEISDRGIITVAGELDAETLTILTVTVSVEERLDSTKKSTGDLDINITDLNDNAPTINEDFLLSIFENDDTPVDFQLIANDNDVTSPNNDIIKFEILSAPFGTTIDEQTQTVTISALVDREKQLVIVLLILAKDGGYPQLEGLANITVDVVDVNERPEFVDDCDKVNVDENTATTICIVQANDYDETDNEVVYSLDNSYNGKFSVGSQNGQLSINPPGLDRETEEEFTLIVQATDNGSPPLSNSKTISVTVNDVNDNNPVFETSHYIYDVNEDFTTRCDSRMRFIGAPLATDADVTGALNSMKYFINGESGNFTVVSETGEIRTISCIDAELGISSYTFTLVAYDDLSPSSGNGTTEVTINIHDINDEPPILEIINGDKKLEKDFVTPEEILFNVTWSDDDVTELNREVSFHCSFHPTLVSDVLECRITDGNIIVKVREGAVTTSDFSAVITIVVQNDAAPLFITYEELQLTVTSTHVPIYFDDQMIYIVEGDSTGNFYNPIIPENTCLLYEVLNHNDIFAIKTGKSVSKLVSVSALDYETNNTFHIHSTVYAGVEVDGNCEPTGANDSAVLTVFVIDENDEPPQFAVLDTNDTFYEGVLFDNLLENGVIFSLSDRVSDKDKSAKLEFSLQGNFSDLSPLLCQSDGRVYMNPEFQAIREVSKTFNYDVKVIDRNTDQNSNSSFCNLQFGILGWKNIEIFRSNTLDPVENTKRKRQATIDSTEDLTQKCLEKGRIGWWDSSGEILIKTDRIIKEKNAVYIWLYGINTSVNLFMEKEDLQRAVPSPEEILKQECRFEDVQITDERTFVTLPLHQYAIVLIAILLLAGILGMIICLLCSWNQYLKEKSFHAERLKNSPEIGGAETKSDDMDSRYLPESEQTLKATNPKQSKQMTHLSQDTGGTGLLMSDLAPDNGSVTDTLRIESNKGDTTTSFVKYRRSSGHFTKMGASALLCTGRNSSSKRSSPIVCLTKNQSTRSCVSGKEVLLNGEESTTDVAVGSYHPDAEMDMYQYPRGVGRKNPPSEISESDTFIGVTLENPAYQTGDGSDEIGSLVVDEIYDTIDESNQTRF